MPRLRLATTTSTADSGLLEVLLPEFEQRYQAEVEVIAVGTGQALALGERGDVDVLLVHARARELAFVAAGHGVNRQDVMYNDFILVGPPDDPAQVAGSESAAAALAAIARAQAPFASRGDESGTHLKELELWQAAGHGPWGGQPWYHSLGQGMGETLLSAQELGAYTLVDRGTFLAMQAQLPTLILLVGGASIAENPDPSLYNLYGVIALNPARHPSVQAALAEDFITWLTSAESQSLIGAFGQARFGQPLFYPVDP